MRSSRRWTGSPAPDVSDGFNPDHFSAFYEVEARHFWFGARNKALYALIASATRGLPAGYRVLEVGCGTGFTLQMLERACPGGRIVGMDLFLEGLRYAKRRAAVPLVQGRMEQPPFTARFDVVGLFDVLEHIADDDAALRQIGSLLAPDGRLVLSVPAGPALWSRFDEEAHHRRRYAEPDLRDKLGAAGFRVEYLTPFMTALYPLARAGRFVSDLVRARRQRSGGNAGSAVLDEIKIRPGFNGVMAALLGADARFVARRWRLPVGTSLLALARPQR